MKLVQHLPAICAWCKVSEFFYPKSKLLFSDFVSFTNKLPNENEMIYTVYIIYYRERIKEEGHHFPRLGMKWTQHADIVFSYFFMHL